MPEDKTEGIIEGGGENAVTGKTPCSHHETFVCRRMVLDAKSSEVNRKKKKKKLTLHKRTRRAMAPGMIKIGVSRPRVHTCARGRETEKKTVYEHNRLPRYFTIRMGRVNRPPKFEHGT